MLYPSYCFWCQIAQRMVLKTLCLNQWTSHLIQTCKVISVCCAEVPLKQKCLYPSCPFWMNTSYDTLVQTQNVLWTCLENNDWHKEERHSSLLDEEPECYSPLNPTSSLSCLKFYVMLYNQFKFSESDMDISYLVVPGVQWGSQTKYS